MEQLVYEEDNRVDQFVEMSGVDRQQAVFFLEAADWDAVKALEALRLNEELDDIQISQVRVPVHKSADGIHDREQEDQSNEALSKYAEKLRTAEGTLATTLEQLTETEANLAFMQEEVQATGAQLAKADAERNVAEEKLRDAQAMLSLASGLKRRSVYILLSSYEDGLLTTNGELSDALRSSISRSFPRCFVSLVLPANQQDDGLHTGCVAVLLRVERGHDSDVSDEKLLPAVILQGQVVYVSKIQDAVFEDCRYIASVAHCRLSANRTLNHNELNLTNDNSLAELEEAWLKCFLTGKDAAGNKIDGFVDTVELSVPERFRASERDPQDFLIGMAESLAGLGIRIQHCCFAREGTVALFTLKCHSDVTRISNRKFLISASGEEIDVLPYSFLHHVDRSLHANEKRIDLLKQSKPETTTASDYFLVKKTLDTRGAFWIPNASASIVRIPKCNIQEMTFGNGAEKQPMQRLENGMQDVFVAVGMNGDQAITQIVQAQPHVFALAVSAAIGVDFGGCRVVGHKSNCVFLQFKRGEDLEAAVRKREFHWPAVGSVRFQPHFNGELLFQDKEPASELFAQWDQRTVLRLLIITLGLLFLVDVLFGNYGTSMWNLVKGYISCFSHRGHKNKSIFELLCSAGQRLLPVGELAVFCGIVGVLIQLWQQRT